MEKKISTIITGGNSKVGTFLVNRLLPNNHTPAIGPIVFLDHVYPTLLPADTPEIPNGDFAHPHRGIATFSYVLSGNLAHYDSRGNHGIIGAGGYQWMKAGNGIIHDEQPLPGVEKNNLFHSLQFWINLPSVEKKSEPDYLAVQAEDVPEVNLPDDAGVLRVLLGEFGSTIAPVKVFSKQFIYHLQLNPKATIHFPLKFGLEYAVFVPSRSILVNAVTVADSKLVTFGGEGDELIFTNPSIESTEAIIFGGEPYNEPIVSQGPFVMNNNSEIADAYSDFFEGKYGTIDYENMLK